MENEYISQNKGKIRLVRVVDLYIMNISTLDFYIFLYAYPVDCVEEKKKILSGTYDS